MDLKWRDPRPGYAVSEASGGKKDLFEGAASAGLERIWSPDIEPVNAVDPTRKENQALLIYPDGRVEYRERYKAHLATRYQMRRFPFDSQSLATEAESFGWSSEALQLEVMERKEGTVQFSGDFSVPGWALVGGEERIASRKEPYDRAPFSKFTAAIRVKRDPGFFVMKLFLPLSFIMFLISATLWITPSELYHRISGTLVGLLTSAASGITVAGCLQKHVDGTYRDAVVLASFFFTAVLAGIHIVSQHCCNSGREMLAGRIDGVFRWLFPLGYPSGAVLLGWIYLT